MQKLLLVMLIAAAGCLQKMHDLLLHQEQPIKGKMVQLVQLLYNIF